MSRNLLITIIGILCLALALSLLLHNARKVAMDIRKKARKEPGRYHSLRSESGLISKNAQVEDFQFLRKLLDSAHPGFYRYREREEMRTFLDSMEQSLDQSLSRTDFYRRVCRVLDRVNCSHTFARMSSDEESRLKREDNFIPLPLKMMGRSYYCNTDEEDIPLGAKIISINGLEIDSIMNRLINFNSEDGFNAQADYYTCSGEFPWYYFLAMGKPGFGKKFKVKYQDPDTGETETEELSPSTLSSEEYWTSEDDFDFKIEDEHHAAVLRIGSFLLDNEEEEKLNKLLEISFRLMKYDKSIRNLVIDCRDNGGGYNRISCKVFSYLAAEPFHEVGSAWTRYKSPPFKNYGSQTDNTEDFGVIDSIIRAKYVKEQPSRYQLKPAFNEFWKPNRYTFEGNVFYLVNHGTGSAATMLGAYISDYGRGTIVGEETGGCYQGSNSFYTLAYELPNSQIKVVLPVANVRFDLKNNKGLPGRGVIPEFEISQSPADLMDDRDTQLDYVLKKLAK